MTELILKKHIDDDKLKTLLDFLKSWGLDVEVRHRKDKETVSAKGAFPFSVGLWEDYAVNSETLRLKAWNRNT